MEVIKCGNGHFYDKSLGDCPYCSGEKDIPGKPLRIPEGLAELSDGFPEMPDLTLEPMALDPKDIYDGYMVYDPQPIEEHLLTGWLVCLSGPDRGESFPVRARQQLSIGREADNDIVIDHPGVEAHHAGIIYDPANNDFFVFTEERFLLNGKTVDDSAKLHHHDILEFGNAKFMFVPFCDETFNWDDDSSFCHP